MTGGRTDGQSGGRTSGGTFIQPTATSSGRMAPLHTGAGDRRAEDREAASDYYSWRNSLAEHLRIGTHPLFDAAEILAWSEHLGVPQVQAAAWLEAFVADLARHRERLRARAAR